MDNTNQENTIDTAPLFLIVDVAKRSKHLIYLDTPEMLSKKIFKERNIKVKIINVADSEDIRYQFVSCRINNKDSELFRECIEELERRFLLTGYRDYRESSLTQLANLIEWADMHHE